MPAITRDDFARMTDELLFDGPSVSRKLSRYWILLVLAAIIASAGIVSDSTATVIGAMIVAPLMTPILGTAFSIVTGDARNLLKSVALVIAGALLVILIAWAMGHLVAIEVVAQTNSQVAGRVNPRIIDLVAALATGAVGAFALSRSDVSDTLPGVAIAISLVPPLAVVGLTLEAGETDESVGALLLFLTNVGAILLSGLFVLTAYRVFDHASGLGKGPGAAYRGAQIAVVAFVLLLAVPLGAATVQTTNERLRAGDVESVAEDWANPAGWRIVAVDAERDAMVVSAAGALPAPSADALREALDARGLEGVDVRLKLVPEEIVELPGG